MGRSWRNTVCDASAPEPCWCSLRCVVICVLTHICARPDTHWPAGGAVAGPLPRLRGCWHPPAARSQPFRLQHRHVRQAVRRAGQGDPAGGPARLGGGRGAGGSWCAHALRGHGIQRHQHHRAGGEARCCSKEGGGLGAGALPWLGRRDHVLCCGSGVSACASLHALEDS